MGVFKRPLIVLHHEDTDHRELWFESDKPVTLTIITVCPQNYPPFEMYELNAEEARRQYKLMTRPIEGWKVEWSDTTHPLAWLVLSPHPPKVEM